MIYRLTALAVVFTLGCVAEDDERGDADAATDAGEGVVFSDANLSADATSLTADAAPIDPDAAPVDPDAGPIDPDALLTYFLTASTAPDVGLAGLDAACNASELRPNLRAQYKALVMSTARRACTSPNCENGADALDWPLLANRRYGKDGAMVFRTDDAAIVSEEPVLDYADAINFWSGGTGDWQLDPMKTCADWTSNSGEAAVGWTGDRLAAFQGGHGFVPCAEQRRLFCVEVP